MEIGKNKLITKLALFNFVLFLIGFDVVTSFFSIFIDNIKDVSQSITIPYRAFSLFVSLSVILFTKRKREKYNAGLILLFIYIAMFGARMFYDYILRSDIHLSSDITVKNSLFYMLMLVTIASFVKSYKYIDLNKAFKWIFLGYSFIIIVNFLITPEFSLDYVADSAQISSGVRNTIDTGYFAAYYLLLSLYFIKNKVYSKLLKFGSFPIILTALVILLRSGSRGPLLALLIALSIFVIVQQKHAFFILLGSSLLILLISYFFEDIVKQISYIAPIMAERIQYTLYSGTQDARIVLFKEGIDAFIDKPFFGSQAMLYRNSLSSATFPHQLIIEAFMSTGFVGGISLLISIIILLKMVLRNLYISISNYWLELIMIAYIVRAMTAGTMFSFSYAVIFVFYFLTRSVDLKIRNI